MKTVPCALLAPVAAAAMFVALEATAGGALSAGLIDPFAMSWAEFPGPEHGRNGPTALDYRWLGGESGTSESSSGARSEGRARVEVAIVDKTLSDCEQLFTRLPADVEIIKVQPESDGIAQIVRALRGRAGIDALHVFSHGEAGRLRLGEDWIGAVELATRIRDLTTIGRALADGGDILLYGSRIGSGDVGRDLVRRLAAATGADVAASGDSVEGAGTGGKTRLEVSEGAIQTATLELWGGSDAVVLVSVSARGAENGGG